MIIWAIPTTQWSQAFTGSRRTGAAAPTSAGLLAASKLRNRRLFETTNTEENAIAAPASIGLSSPAAANGYGFGLLFLRMLVSFVGYVRMIFNPGVAPVAIHMIADVRELAKEEATEAGVVTAENDETERKAGT